MRVAGLLLAAGAGVRYGGPKALARDPDGTSWLVRSAEALSAGGCDPVVVVLGAAAEEALAVLDEARVPVRDGVTGGVRVVRCEAWRDGMGASLRAGLRSLAGEPEDVGAVLVHLVDLPDVGPEVVARVRAGGDGPGSLARAAYQGRPGHPVLLGREHWPAVVEDAEGDRGARDHLARHPHRLVECGDLAGGRDRDTPGPALPGGPNPRPTPRA